MKRKAAKRLRRFSGICHVRQPLHGCALETARTRKRIPAKKNGRDHEPYANEQTLTPARTANDFCAATTTDVEGLENLLKDKPWLLIPNHVSYLDPFAVAAVLNWDQLRQTYWAGWTGIVSANAIMRFLSWLGKILPVEPTSAACRKTRLRF